jgi:hypothetical protein
MTNPLQRLIDEIETLEQQKKKNRGKKMPERRKYSKTASKRVYPAGSVWTGESISKKKCSRHVMFQTNLWQWLQHKAKSENKSVSGLIEELLLQSLLKGGKP